MSARAFAVLSIVLVLLVGTVFAFVQLSNKACPVTAKYQAARRAEAQASAAYNAKRYVEANVILDSAISKFGTLTPSHPTHDDTGMYLNNANWHERHGDIRAAAIEKRGVLDGRLGMWEFENGCKHQRFIWN